MPLAQAITTVVAQPRADACRLHCVEHFYSTTNSLTNVMAHMLHIALFKDLCQNVILDQTNLLAAARTSNMSLHTSGHVVAPKSGLFACHHASNADGEPRKNDTLNQ